MIKKSQPVFFLLDLSTWAIYILFIYPRFISPIKNVPCAKGAYPIVGHFITLLRDTRGDEALRMCLETPNSGLVRLKGLFNSDQLLLTSPKAISEVLVKNPYDFPKPEMSRNFLRVGIGDGLVVAEGAHHKRQRKHAMPSFTFRKIKNLYPLFWEKAVKMTKVIDKDAFGDQHSLTSAGFTDIDRWAPKATLDIIGIAGLGRDFNTLEHSKDQIALLYEDIFTPTVGTRTVAALLVLFGVRLTALLAPSASSRIFNAVSGIRDLCHRFIRERRDELQSPGCQPVDTLSSLIHADVFADHELVDQLLTLIAAGHETTSSTFTWIVYLLTLHPDVQSRLRAEVHAALPAVSTAHGLDFDPNIGEILESLPLLNGVCNETLRIFPPVPMTMRQSSRNTTLIGQPIAAGTIITVAPWAVNNSPELWGPDAREFKPERWIDQNTGKPNQTGGVSTNYAFLTFLHGPRSCIGQGFARAELRALLAAFVGAFEWTMADPEEKIIPAIVITAKPKSGLKIKLKRARDW
ncbi:cytochrome P450 [Aspergillus ambiguus]|uniref:cytochrome P450 n=1 Tax=Aspergillus ambiguus TaxID=176160 RepID=UPI003CCDB975